MVNVHPSCGAYRLLQLLAVAAATATATAAASPITYTKLAATDSGPGSALQWKHCAANCTCAHHGGPCSVSVLEQLCRSTPHCAGFNSNGWLKSCVAKSCGQTLEQATSDLYVGSSVLPGPWPPPPAPAPPAPPAPGPWHPQPWRPSPPAPPMPPVSPPAPVPLVDDWHFPAEEAAELAAAPQLKVQQVNVQGNLSGTILLAEGDSPPHRLAINDSTPSGWQLRSFIVGSAVGGAPIAVLERDWNRWGFLLFVQASSSTQLGRCGMVAAPAACFMARKGVGLTSALDRPRYALEAADPDYFVKARNDPHDWLKARISNTSDGEPTYESAASVLPPSRDYAMVGNLEAHTKFSVSPDGRLTSGNNSIFTSMEQGNKTGSSRLLFDPRNYTAYWPDTNFSEYKSAVVGRGSRAVTVSAWHKPAGRGFAMMAVPNTYRGIQKGGNGTPYDPAEILLRLEDVTSSHKGPARYFGVLDCQRAAAEIRALSPAEFYAHMLFHTLGWSQFHNGNGLQNNTSGGQQQPMQLRLDSNSSEGTRLVDMARAVISSAMTMWIGERPNYGDGSVYWSITAHDAGSLPLESFALDRALLLWGHPREAASRVEFYLNTYIRNSSGWTPENHVGMIRNPLWKADGSGPPGSLDLKQWGCGHGPGGAVMPHNFQESYADYGRWLDLWVHVARAIEHEEGGKAWIQRTWSQIHQLVNYTLFLHDDAVLAQHPFPAEGLLVGPAEHDTCSFYGPFFSINTWTWRGWLVVRNFLLDTAALPNAGTAYCEMLGARIDTLSRALHVAANASLVMKDNLPYFLPPFAAVNTTPFGTMIEPGAQGSFGGSSYVNFRYWAEMLSSGFFSNEVSHAISNFRETHSGTLSGMTRFLDHLDDMPAEGYAFSAMELSRVQSFQALLFGHMANYHSRGVHNAPEQLSLYGDGVQGLWTYSDSYRAFLKESDDLEIDFCVPSTTLPAIMVRWMFLWEESDRNTIALFRMTPRRYFAPGGHTVIEMSNAPSRFGSVGANVSIVSAPESLMCPLTARASLQLQLHGHGFISAGLDTATRALDIEVRLRTHGGCNGARYLATASVLAGAANASVIRIDNKSETVTVRLITLPSLENYLLTVIGHFAEEMLPEWPAEFNP